MRRPHAFTSAIAAALLGGGLAACGGSTPSTGPGPESVSVRLLDATGGQVGTAVLTATGTGVGFHVDVTHLAPGGHGFRITSVGRCDGPDFTTAGPVLDLTGDTVQATNQVGHLAGALPDLPVGDDGKGTADFVDDLVTLDRGGANSLRGAKGSALIVTAGPADASVRSTTTGPRIACGVISPEPETSPTPSPSPTPTASPTVSVQTSTTTVTVTRSATPTPAPPTHTAAPPTPSPSPTP
ncbi:MAG TPA: superoxide dismutase family protein [Candidatus Dormibacteraeota bacterium]